MDMTQKEYQQYVEQISPKSPIWKDVFNAFWVGGLICTLGQLILMGWQKFGLEEVDAATATSVSLVFLSALLTGLSLYDDIAKVGGAGTLVPITGFANAVSSPAVEYQTEGYILGIGTKIFSIAGPVIVYGTIASVIYGLIYWVGTML